VDAESGHGRERASAADGRRSRAPGGRPSGGTVGTARVAEGAPGSAVVLVEERLGVLGELLLLLVEGVVADLEALAALLDGLQGPVGHTPEPGPLLGTVA